MPHPIACGCSLCHDEETMRRKIDAQKIDKAADNREKVFQLVRSALSQKGDDVCWKDLYNAEVAGLVGLADFDPALLPRDQFLGNCSHYYDCLAAEKPYQTPEPPASHPSGWDYEDLVSALRRVIDGCGCDNGYIGNRSCLSCSEARQIVTDIDKTPVVVGDMTPIQVATQQFVAAFLAIDTAGFVVELSRDFHGGHPVPVSDGVVIEASDLVVVPGFSPLDTIGEPVATKAPAASYEALRASLVGLPPTWYPALLRILVEAGYAVTAWKPGEARDLVASIEHAIKLEGSAEDLLRAIDQYVFEHNNGLCDE